MNYLCAFKALDAASEPSWFQVTPPYGKYPAGASLRDDSGKPVPGALIVFDRESTDRVIEAFNALKAAKGDAWTGLLVDQEHFSLDASKPSTALAWAKDIRRADDGSLWTRWEFTAKGEELYNGKMLVSRSPVLRLERKSKTDFAPTMLESIGMTNTPHFKDLSPLAAARDADNPNNNQKGDPMDQEILAALGLPAEATKEEALAAIAALKDGEKAAIEKATDAEKQKDAAEKEKDEAQAECRALKADAFIRDNADKISDVAKFREVYLANPQVAEQTLALCRSAAPQTRIAARDAKTPAENVGVRDQLAKCRSAEEMANFAVAHAKELADAMKV